MVEEPIISVKEGKLCGLISEDARGNKFYSFLGIPYAKPPIGPLRFKAPLPIDPWEGVFNAIDDGNLCVQEDPLTKTMQGSEDCLNLNVYTPCLQSSSDTLNPPLKPVMVYIHGGSFLAGSNLKSLHGPEFLVAEDIVVVSINYRLGIFGFLSLEDHKLNIPGNAALKDMVLALKWVQRNIRCFMGDPKNVTIFGNSAGAAAVHFLVLSPLAKGLFHKALCQSGSALSSWAYGIRNGKVIGRAMGLEEKSEEEVLAYLMEASSEEIFEAQCKINSETVQGNRTRFIGVVVEPKSCKGEKLFSTHPVKILQSGKYNKVPILMGYNSGDGMIVDAMVAPELNYVYWTDKEFNVPGLLQLKKGSTLSKRLGEEIIKFYFGNGDISRDTHLQEFYDITTDNSFLRGIYASVKIHRNTSKVPIYMYRLSLESELNFYKKILGIELPGVCHADELGYLFRTILTEIPSPGSIEDVAQRRMTRLWTNFAKYGNPTPYLDPSVGLIWPRVMDANRIPFLDIGQNLRIDENPEDNRMKFWDKIYAKGKLCSKL